MKISNAKNVYQGADWATERPALAQALGTLDDLHALSLGFMPDATLGEMDESDMLRLMGELAQTALGDLDFLSADLMPTFLRNPQAGWATFEARELLTDLVLLCAEAKSAMRGRDELPRALTFELGYLTGRIKELIKAIDGAN